MMETQTELNSVVAKIKELAVVLADLRPNHEYLDFVTGIFETDKDYRAKTDLFYFLFLPSGGDLYRTKNEIVILTLKNFVVALEAEILIWQSSKGR
jgi:hypothetical protein